MAKTTIYTLANQLAKCQYFWLFACFILLTGCGGGSDNSDSSTSTPPAVAPPVVPPQEEEPLGPDLKPDPPLPEKGSMEWSQAVEASRLLVQATFGPTAKDINAVMQTSREAWLDNQLIMPPTLHLPLLDQRFTELGMAIRPDPEPPEDAYQRDLQRSDIWWQIALRADDQLRQRVAFALSQIFVISNVDSNLFNDSRGIANYQDILLTHAFGNFRDLLQAITLNPLMGKYLSMIRNEKADPVRNIRPDENYAREIMQLFSIGLVELNLDGTEKQDTQGHPIPTYDQETIKTFARVFTGWNTYNAEYWWSWNHTAESEVRPMKAFQEIHDTEEKVLLNGQMLPAGQTAEKDMQDALDNIFAHNNVAPFIAKQLIQRLITSNPSPNYVARVASVFNDNGLGIRGDLKAVIKAIYMDDEAINGHKSSATVFGKLKEPLLKISALWRTFKAQGVPVIDDNNNLQGNRIRFLGSDRNTGQRPFGSFSVFNFYRPEYQHPGAISDADLTSPEFQILTESTIVSKTNFIASCIYWRDKDQPNIEENINYNWDVYPPRLNLDEEKALTNNISDLLDRLDLLLLQGRLSQTAKTALTSHLELVPANNDDNQRLRVYEAIYLLASSPEYAVQR